MRVNRRLVPFVAAASVLVTAGCSSTTMAQQTAQKAPPSADYKKVSTLVALPDYLPGLGTLYVVPPQYPPVRSSRTTARGIS